MNKLQLFYLLFLLVSWTVDLVHWEEWGHLDEKYGTEVEEAVSRSRVRVSILGRCAEAVHLIADRLLSFTKRFVR